MTTAAPSAERAPTAGVPSTAVVVVTYNSRADVPDCFGSLERALRGRLPAVLVIAVDNASTDGTADRILAEYPWVTVIANDRNLGFAAGNNQGIRHARAHGCAYVYLLNPDTEVTPGFLDEALATAGAYPGAASVQSLLLLHGERDRVNTAGNQIHFLGFGFCGSFRSPAADVPDQEREIPFASGACTLYRGDALERVGLLDEDLFLYQEDMDLGWRLRLAGFSALLAPRSVVYHKYALAGSGRKFYYLERNRLLVLLKNMRWRTLIILAPLLLAAELAVLGRAFRGGWAGEKLRATGHLLRPSTWAHIRRGRREQARLRVVPDAGIVRHFTPVLEFEGVTTPFIRRVVNPTMARVWGAARSLIR